MSDFSVSNVNILQVLIEVNNNTDGLLFNVTLLVIYLIMIGGLSRVYSFKNVLLATSTVMTLISGLMYLNELISGYFVSFFLIISIGALIYRIMTGD